ncbi:MAG: hypothetical protein IPL54_06760 [Chitinophagaceae bacterium]|nr:hypothetical protein [Chitinophagaceae bacterium]
MKINLAAKDQDVKDNNPAGYCYCCFKGIEYECKQQKKHINYNSCVTQYHKSAFQPGKRQYMCTCTFIAVVLFNIPKNDIQQKTNIEYDGYFGEETHG